MVEKKLSPYLAPNSWLPYFIGGVGVALSVLFWYSLWSDIQAYFDFLHATRNYLSWLALVAGIIISFLIGATIRVAQVANERAQSLVVVNQDLKKEIGERIQAEEIKQKLEVALLQGQKLQAMGTLAGGIAHDFNNLLYAIIGYVEMARDDVEQDSLVHKNLGKVLEATHRGQELVSRILSFSRRQQHQFDVINIKSNIEAALSLLRPTIPASVMINLNSPEDAFIHGNPTQIHQVLVNLINNAVDAMDGEGVIDIVISKLIEGDEYLAQFPEMNAKRYCKIEIKDTGHGMDQHTLARIFEPFYTTKEVGKGTGLGLSIVHNIIKDHQGEITVTSLLGKGTKFTILLPEHSG